MDCYVKILIIHVCMAFLCLCLQYIYIYYVHKFRSIWVDLGIQNELMLIRESPI